MERWLTALSDEVQRTYRERNHGLLLSRVPKILRDAGFDVDALLQGRKLRVFLENEAGSQFQLIQSEASPVLWVLLPPDVPKNLPNSSYFPAVTKEPRSPRRFISTVWTAFVKELAPDDRRWLLLGDRVRFVDLPKSETPPNGHEISREFIEGNTLVDSEEAIIGKIERWAAEAGVPLTRLHVGARSPRRSDDDSVLHAFLSALKPSERARVSMPGDIIARLLGVD